MGSCELRAIDARCQRGTSNGKAIAFLLSLILASACGNGDGSSGTTTFGGGGGSDLLVIGGADLDASGPEGGPFGASVDYGVSNQGQSDLTWVVLASDAWIQLSAVSGTLAGGETVQVTASINEAVAAGMAPGTYLGTVTFRDQVDPAADVIRPATLTVVGPSGAAPTIDTIEPPFGPYSGGNMITLRGAGFDDGTPLDNELWFGGVQATNLQVVDEATVTAMVPPGTPDSEVDVLYVNDDGSDSRGNGYGYNPTPTLDSVTPAMGPANGGNIVMLEGSGYQARQPGINVVTFGGVQATDVIVNGNNQLTCVVPPGNPGESVDIMITNDNGQIQMPGIYTFNAPPVLVGVSPASGPDVGGNTVSLRGAGFLNNSPGINLVEFDAQPATNVIVVDDTTLTCVVPPGTAGVAVDVTVTNANGTATLPGGYAYQGSLSLLSVNPASGPASGGNNVTLAGSGFSGAGVNSVSFGTASATNVFVVDDGTITCDVPAGAPGTSVNVAISNSNGVASLPNGYGYLSVGVNVVAVNPAAGRAAGGSSVTVSGSGFQIGVSGSVSVDFGGNAASNVLVVDDATLTCVVPGGAEGTSVDVSVSNSNGSDTLSNAYTYHAAPTLSSVNPTSGSATGGNTVTVSGSGFQDGAPGANSVSFGGQPATNIVVSTDSSLTCRVPSGVAGTTVNLVLSNANGSDTLTGAYTYNAAPNLTVVTPPGGPASAGNTVTISGSGFQNGGAGQPSVTFGGIAAGNIQVVDDGAITCRVPSGSAGASVDVRVSNSNGSDTLPDGYAYHAEPTVTFVNPTSGSAAGGNTVTLGGSGFQSGSPGTNMVSFGGQPATNVVVASDSSLSCVVPAGVPGVTVNVTLSNANGSDTLTGAYSYNAGPSLAAVTPSSGPASAGNTVTLSGTGFQAGGAGQPGVTFGGVAASNIQVVNDTTITCRVPAGTAGSTVDVAVSNSNGADSLSNGYSYHGEPTLTSVNPASGNAVGGNTVTLSGSGFQAGNPGSNTVSFGGQPATNVVVSNDSSLTCVVPAGVQGATVDVALSNANGSDSLAGAYTYNAGPILTAVNPASGPAAGGNQVTLSGQGFQNGGAGQPSVTFGGASATNLTIVSDISIFCDVPTGTAGATVDVVLTNANGTDTLFSGYSYNGATSLTAVTPSSGPSAGGNVVSLSGTGFQDGSPGNNTVTFDGIAAANVQVSSDSLLSCQVPAGVAGTAVDVEVSNANGSASMAGAYSYEVPATLVPGTGFTASGQEGGPFSPNNVVYVLTNTGSVDLDWSVVVSDTFVFVDGPSAGTLSSGQTENVTLRLAAVVTNFTPGVYSASATFTNVGAGETIGVRAVNLSVLSVGAEAGWTVFTESADTRKIYVSNNGSDANDGLSPATPKRTISAGRALLRDGFPDWLHIERGGTWNESIGNNWSISGRSATEKMVVMDYGNPASPRPTITGVGVGMDFANGAQHVAVSGFRFVGLSGDRGVDGHAGIDDILIENCFFDGANLSFQTPGSVSPPPRNVRIYRCVIANCGEDGLFTNEAQFFTIEQCLFYNNGLDDVIRKHNIYMSGNNGPNAQSGNGHDSTDNTVKDCLILKAGGNAAIKWRAQFNGVIQRNVLSHNRITVGMHTKWPNEYSINNKFLENVIVDQGNPDAPTYIRGVGVNGVWDAEVAENIIARNPRTQGGGNHAIALQMPQYDENTSYAGQFFPSSKDVVIRDNIVYGWNGHNLLFSGAVNMGTNQYENVQVLNNDFQNVSPDSGIVKRLVNFTDPARFGPTGAVFSGNRYWSMWSADTWFRIPGNQTYSQWLTSSGEIGSSQAEISYTDPNRDLATYAAHLGIGSTFDDFVNAAMQQEKGSWNTDLEALTIVNYVRDGFDKPAIAP